MKNKTVKALATLLAVTTVSMMGTAGVMASDTTAEDTATEAAADTEESTEEADATEEAADDTAEASDDDQAAADNVAALIDKIYVQERTDTTDED